MSVAFGQVADIQANLLVGWAVSDGEVEPVDVASGVGVNSQEKVILCLTNFDSTIEVSPFEPRFEDELLLQIQGRVHAFEGTVEYLVFVELIMHHALLHIQGGTLNKELFLATFLSSKG